MVAIIDIIANIVSETQKATYRASIASWMSFSALYNISGLVLVSSTFFTFEFGYAAYLKVYGKIHGCCYRRAISGYNQVNYQDTYVELENE